MSVGFVKGAILWMLRMQVGSLEVFLDMSETVHYQIPCPPSVLVRR